MNSKKYIIGTRGSLLALTQCNQIKDQLEKITGDQFELEIIKTQGDLITNAPLWQLEGKDFFTRELDQALLEKKIDLVVHSYKDLGSVRPEEITLAAITKRSYAHDILLIKKETLLKLNEMTVFHVGTSSPRRMENLRNYFKEYLPSESISEIKPVVLRGNVNTRIQKLLDGEFDAIVLAMPGLERLAITEKSRTELEKLIKDLTFMVLPESEFPSAASQGALAIECLKNRSDNGELLKKLKMIEDQTTLEEVSRERKAFKEYGGGCHLAVGIHVEKRGDFYCHYHRGLHEGKAIDLQTLELANEKERNLPSFFTKPKFFYGLSEKSKTKFNFGPNVMFDQLTHKHALPVGKIYGEQIYITSKYCFHAIDNSSDNPENGLSKKECSEKFLWAAGTKTMKDLAKLGFWVHGTSDSLGDSELEKLRDSKFLQMFFKDRIALTVLSHDKSTSTLGNLTPVYTHLVRELTPALKKEILEVDFFYWTSFTQYMFYVELIPEIKNKIHGCGLGKTYERFKEIGMSPIPFLSMKEISKYIKSFN